MRVERIMIYGNNDENLVDSLLLWLSLRSIYVLARSGYLAQLTLPVMSFVMWIMLYIHQRVVAYFYNIYSLLYF